MHFALPQLYLVLIQAYFHGLLLDAFPIKQINLKFFVTGGSMKRDHISCLMKWTPRKGIPKSIHFGFQWKKQPASGQQKNKRWKWAEVPGSSCFREPSSRPITGIVSLIFPGFALCKVSRHQQSLSSLTLWQGGVSSDQYLPKFYILQDVNCRPSHYWTLEERYK